MSKTYISELIRQRIRVRANGICEYCLLSESVSFSPFEVDHIIAEKHGGLSHEENLALACSICNKNKGTDIASLDPLTHELTPLYHPRRDHWRDHFMLIRGRIEAKTSIGRVTVQLLKLNTSTRISERELIFELGFLESYT